MTNETKPVKGKVGITSIKIETMPKNEQEIKRIKFVTGPDTYISWRPKVTKTEYRKGFETEITVPLEFDLLPNKILEMNSIIREKGAVQVNAEYTVMKVTEDGVESTYRFIKSEAELNKWSIFKENIQEEQIQ